MTAEEQERVGAIWDEVLKWKNATDGMCIIAEAIREAEERGRVEMREMCAEITRRRYHWGSYHEIRALPTTEEKK